MSIYGSLPSYITSIDEAFVGKSPILEEIEKNFEAIRTKYSKFSDINHSPELIRINRLFEQQFGMEVFALHIDPSDAINAFTNVIAYRIDTDNKYIDLVRFNATKGYFFEKGNNLCIIMTMYHGLLMNPSITPEELVAVCLHEIGHNFADAIDNDIQIDNKKFVEMLVTYYTYETLAKYGFSNTKTKEEKKKDQSKKSNKFRGILNGVSGVVKDKVQFITYILTGGVLGYDYNKAIRYAEINGADKAAKKSLGRRNEAIADKFAGCYGYGPAQASCLIKMDKAMTNGDDSIIYKVPIIGPFIKAARRNFFRKVGSMDVHGQTIQRLNEELALLEYELAHTDLDPKLVAVIKAQIKQLKDARDELIKVAPTASEQDKLDAEYNAYINSTEPTMVDEELENKINEEFNSVKKG